MLSAAASLFDLQSSPGLSLHFPHQRAGRGRRVKRSQMQKVLSASRGWAANWEKRTTMSPAEQEETLIEKIRMLPPDKVAEVEDLVDFMLYRDDARCLVRGAGKLSEECLRAVWDNDEDAAYDGL